MVIISTGDQSGRPDTSGVDRDLAENYARRMFEAVVSVNFAMSKKLHMELNADWALYSLSIDLFRGMCKQRGVHRAAERWREYLGET